MHTLEIVVGMIKLSIRRVVMVDFGKSKDQGHSRRVLNDWLTAVSPYLHFCESNHFNTGLIAWLSGL